MGITVKTTFSWRGYTSLYISASNQGFYVQDYAMWSNTEQKWENLGHSSPTYICVQLFGIPSGQSVRVDVWVYG